jgi:hypothetical protein
MPLLQGAKQTVIGSAVSRDPHMAGSDVVTQVCNPSHLGSGDGEDLSLRSAGAKSL